MGRQEKQRFRRHTRKRFAQPQECFSAGAPQRLCAGTCLTDCRGTAGSQQETASSLVGTWTPALPIDLWWSLRPDLCVFSVLPSISSDWTVCCKPGTARAWALIYPCSGRKRHRKRGKGREFYSLRFSAAGDLINRHGWYGSKTSGRPRIVTSISLPTLVAIKLQQSANYSLWPKLDSQIQLGAHSSALPFVFNT